MAVLTAGRMWVAATLLSPEHTVLVLLRRAEGESVLEGGSYCRELGPPSLSLHCKVWVSASSSWEAVLQGLRRGVHLPGVCALLGPS